MKNRYINLCPSWDKRILTVLFSEKLSPSYRQPINNIFGVAENVYYVKAGESLCTVADTSCGDFSVFACAYMGALPILILDP